MNVTKRSDLFRLASVWAWLYIFFSDKTYDQNYSFTGSSSWLNNVLQLPYQVWLLPGPTHLLDLSLTYQNQRAAQLIKNLSGSLLPLAFRQWRLYSSRPLPPAISLHLLLRETTRVSLTIQVVQEIQLDLLVLRGLAQAIMSLRFLQEILSLERYGGG